MNTLTQQIAFGKSANHQPSRVSQRAEPRAIRHEVRKRLKPLSIPANELTRDEVDRLLRSPAGFVRAAVQLRRLPRLPSTLRPADLSTSVRVQTCLKNLGASHGVTDLGKLRHLTIGELLCLKGFGPKSLRDLLSSVAPMILDYITHTSGDSSNHRQTIFASVTHAAQRLRSLSYSVQIRCTDPRFAPEVGALLYAANFGSEAPPLDVSASLHAVAQRLVSRTRDLSKPKRTLRAIRKLHDKIARAQRMSLEKELRDITQAFATAKNLEIILSSVGGDSQGAKTLQAVGDEFHITRERVRQITSEFIQKVRQARPFAPILRRTIVKIGERLPVAADNLEAELCRLGLTQSLFRVDGILGAAKLLGVSVPFIVESHRGLRSVVRRENAGLAKTIVRLAQKRVSHAGMCKVADLRDQVQGESLVSSRSEWVREVLQSLRSLHWLDQKREWFFLDDVPRNHLVTRVTKLLSVASRIHISEMRAAIANDHRVRDFAPPKSVVLEFCRAACNCALDGEYLVASYAPSATEVLSEGERLAYSVLQDEGPLLDRSAFKSKCIARGMNRNTFDAYIRRLPILARYGPGAYGLRGALQGPLRTQLRDSRLCAAGCAGSFPSQTLRTAD